MTTYVWTVVVPFTVPDFARGIDKNVIERRLSDSMGCCAHVNLVALLCHNLHA